MRHRAERAAEEQSGSHESESLTLCAIFHESQQITALRTMTSPLAVHVFESQISFPE
jgi:hypothetical protein